MNKNFFQTILFIINENNRENQYGFWKKKEIKNDFYEIIRKAMMTNTAHLGINCGPLRKFFVVVKGREITVYFLEVLHLGATVLASRQPLQIPLLLFGASFTIETLVIIFKRSVGVQYFNLL